MKDHTMFTSVSTRAATAYQRVGIETSVNSADPHQLVNLLYEALLKSLGSAVAAMKRKDIATKCTEIGRAVRLIEDGLTASLDEKNGGDLARNLSTLYDYCTRRLMLANAENDPEKIEEVLRLIEPIAAGWKQIRPQVVAGA
jgi:flagellar protein FliS